MSPHHPNDSMINSVAVIGTIATWTLQGVLSVLATICTLIVVGPKAIDQLTAWYARWQAWRAGRKGDE
jgi:hypothetical protein